MKTFEEYRFTIRHSDIKMNEYKYHPENKDELEKIIGKEIKLQGWNVDLNCVDTSKITDMSFVFCNSKFNGDISNWDTCNVKDMSYAFCNSIFNGDISGWDVSNVKDMDNMFKNSKFEGDISKWDVNNVLFKGDIFKYCPIKEEYKPKFK